MHEISKWKSTCQERKFILVAPQGSTNPTDPRLGWNAIDCCGYPASHQVDDVDFANGIVKALDNLTYENTQNVVATGFSNGGFFVSMLGLLPHGTRPAWLKAIVPTGGYQYDTSLYNSNVESLPMFAHHGGRDGVVRPDGCCRDPSKGDGKSNCPLGIGVLRDSCLSVQQAFSMWATVINGCNATIEITIDGASCWQGSHCRTKTRLCMWPEEGHVWGGKMPGVDMVGEFLAELDLRIQGTKKEEMQPVAYKDTSSWRGLFSCLLVIAILVIAALAAWIRMPQKRNKSTRMEQEALVELVDVQTTNSRTRKAITCFV